MGTWDSRTREKGRVRVRVGASRVVATPGRGFGPRALLSWSLWAAPGARVRVGGGRAAAGLQLSFVRRRASAGHRGAEAARERVRKPGSRAGALVTLHEGVGAGPTQLATPPTP